MTRSVLPGQVEWTGDNPSIYLSEDGGNSWSVLALMFRIAWSAHGPGNAMLILERPSDLSAEVMRFCASDNQPLARYLCSEFVPYFGVFRQQAGLSLLEFIELSSFGVGDHEDGSYRARGVTAEYGSVEMTWRDLREPFAVDAPPEETATGRHIMLSVFRPADDASITVGSRVLPGALAERTFFGGRSLSSALAFSESWVRVR